MQCLSIPDCKIVNLAVKHQFIDNKKSIYSNFQRGYDELQGIVPTCTQNESLGATKLSKATVLQRCKYMYSFDL